MGCEHWQRVGSGGPQLASAGPASASAAPSAPEVPSVDASVPGASLPPHAKADARSAYANVLTRLAYCRVRARSTSARTSSRSNSPGSLHWLAHRASGCEAGGCGAAAPFRSSSLGLVCTTLLVPSAPPCTSGRAFSLQRSVSRWAAMPRREATSPPSSKESSGRGRLWNFHAIRTKSTSRISTASLPRDRLRRVRRLRVWL